jgi:hypothetical protein
MFELNDVIEQPVHDVAARLRADRTHAHVRPCIETDMTMDDTDIVTVSGVAASDSVNVIGIDE